MASSSSSSSSSSSFSVLFCLQLLVALLMFCFSELCFCFHTKHLSSLSTVGTQWSPAGATWYGSPDGAGSDGGSCGYGGAVAQAPFSSLITSVGPSLYNSGKGCGVCYQVKCTEHPSCSKKPVTVVITDSCLGCTSESAHFDLSGTSFGAMAIPGQEKKLQDAGMLKIQFARVACKYPGKTIAFRVDEGSNSNYFAVVVEFESGDGDLASVSLKQEATNIQSGNQWRSLQQSWGADWKIDAGSELHAPFSIRLTSRYSGQTIVAKNVIPVGWKPGAIYRSVVNF